MLNKQIIIIFALSIRNKMYNIKKRERMATKEEWREYFERLKTRIDIINKSNLDEATKEKLTDELLEKMNIVSKYFYEE